MTLMSGLSKSVALALVAAAVILPARILPANAATIVLIQEWEVDNSNPLNTFSTGARWDDSGLTGVGTEFFFLDRFTASNFIGGIGQFSAVAQFTLPQSLTIPGNTVARYINGIFDGFGNTNTPGGGTPAVQLEIEATGFGAGAFGFRNLPGPQQQQFVYFPPISGERRYDLVSSQFVTPSAVPLPAALPLSAAGLSLLGFLGWRKRRKGAGPASA